MTEINSTLTCVVCQAEYLPRLNKDGTSRKTKYCSGKCRIKSGNLEIVSPKVERIVKVCPECGASLDPLPPGKAKRVTYCSRECSISARKRADRESIYSTFWCRNCWKPYVARASEKRSFVYCSNECRYAGRARIVAEMAAIRALHARVSEHFSQKAKSVEKTIKVEVALLNGIRRRIACRFAVCAFCGAAHVRRIKGSRFCSYICKEENRKQVNFRMKQSDRFKASRRAHKYKRKALLRGLVAEKIDPIAIFNRDGWRCYLCGRETPIGLRGSYEDDAPELEHKVSLAHGGSHTNDNVACACRRCNREKGANSYIAPKWGGYQ